MTLRALIFGSIGTLVETSDLQRRAYNRAFEECGVPWTWSREEYRHLLSIPGGLFRLRGYAAARGGAAPLDPALLKRIHRLKTEAMQTALTSERIVPRPGVGRILREAREAGLRLAFATTTEPVTVESIRTRLTPHLGASVFDAVLDRTMVERDKPAPDVYESCLERLGVAAREALAVEDTPESLAAAMAAGVACVATPGEYHRGRDFSGAAAVLDSPGDPEGPGGPTASAPWNLARLLEIHAAATGGLQTPARR